MIRLNTINRSVQLVLGGTVTTNQLPVLVSYSDKTATAYTGAVQLSNSNDTSVVTICSAPAASTIRDVDYISIANRDTANTQVEVLYDDNGTSYQITQVTLEPNDQLIYTHASGWHTQDSMGNTKVTSTGGGGGSGTVTSVQVSGGTTGLTTSGGPVTTSGTITLAGTLDADNGGTGQNTYTTGDLLYASGATTLTKLNIGSTNQVLTVVGGVPTWQPASGGGSGTVTSVAATQPAAGLTISGSPITTSGTFVFALADDLLALEGLSGTGIAVRTGASAWTNRTITGTAARVTVTNGDGVSGNPTLDIASTYVGQASITTLGTITTGTWNATTVGAIYGGTGLSTYTTGDLIYASATNTLAKLAAGTNGQVLTVASGLPTWADAGSGIPVGTIVDFGGTAAPTGWLLLYGQNVSRTTYAALFSVFSTTYGVGDGSTTFGLPDLRGRVSAGKDDMGGTSANRLTGLPGGVNGDTLGGVGGDETHILTTAQLATHAHGLRSGTGGGANTRFMPGAFSSTYSGSTLQMTADVEGGGAAHNNVQPTIILNKIVYAGV